MEKEECDKHFYEKVNKEQGNFWRNFTTEEKVLNKKIGKNSDKKIVEGITKKVIENAVDDVTFSCLIIMPTDE